MKQIKYKPFFYVLFVLICFFSCIEDVGIPNKGLLISSIKEGRFDLNDNEFLTMLILTKESENSSFILKVENKTKSHLTYGKIFSLEYFNNNNWESIPLNDHLWELIGFSLSVDSFVDEQIDLYMFINKYNNGKKGIYQLTKSFILHSDLNHDNVIRDIKMNTQFEVK
jgi:hypothetical protein